MPSLKMRARAKFGTQCKGKVYKPTFIGLNSNVGKSSMVKKSGEVKKYGK